MSFRSSLAQPTECVQVSGAADTHLSGLWLILIRSAWIALVLVILGIFIASLPASFATLHQPCIGTWCSTYGTGQLTVSQMHSLLQAGISLNAYAWSWIAFTGVTALVWIAVGGILFWRKSDNWMVLLVALMLIIMGVTSVTDVLLFSSSAWRIPEDGLYLLKSMALLLTLALFPNGRFVPRWAGGIVLIYPAYVLSYLVFVRPLHIPGWTLYSSPINAIAWFGSSITLTLAQLYRYVRVSNLRERQQTKWVAFGFLVSLLLGDFGVSAASNLLPLQQLGWLQVLLSISSYLIVLLIPLSIGFAMLRYHLWDIDVIVNRRWSMPH